MAKWDIYYRLERKHKKTFLKKLTKTDGFRMLDELYRFAYKIGPKSSFKKLDMNKINTLARVHSIFGKVKL